jgi:hypothetical protein
MPLAPLGRRGRAQTQAQICGSSSRAFESSRMSRGRRDTANPISHATTRTSSQTQLPSLDLYRIPKHLYALDVLRQ